MVVKHAQFNVPDMLKENAESFSRTDNRMKHADSRWESRVG